MALEEWGFGVTDKAALAEALWREALQRGEERGGDPGKVGSRPPRWFFLVALLGLMMRRMR